MISSSVYKWVVNAYPGLLLCSTIAAASYFLAARYGAPSMLFALLLGMAFNFMAEPHSKCRVGVEFTSRTLLRLGVGLLGIRIALSDFLVFGWKGIFIVVGLVVVTIGFGFFITKLLGRKWRFALMTGGAVAICGASAALAIASVIPHNSSTERNVLFTIVSVTSLSTVAMIIYPAFFGYLGFSELHIGYLIGATIHDVAQVVGAGYTVSDVAGDTAIMVKLFRVALLPVVLVIITLFLHFKSSKPSGNITFLPWFMILFLVLVFANTLMPLSEWFTSFLSSVSRVLLIVAIAALGVKTSLGSFASMSPGHALTVTFETLFLLVAAVFLVAYFM